MFFKRLISGALLLGIACGAFYLGGAVLSCLICFVSLCACRELTNAFHLPMQPWYFRGALGIFAYFITIVPFPVYGQLAVTVLSLMVFLFLYVICYPRLKSWDIMIAYGLMIYSALPLTYICLTSALDRGRTFIWLILISSWGADTLAYCAGSLFGRHKLTPRLSPGKSLEGAIGGTIGAALIGGLYGAVMTWFGMGVFGGLTAPVFAGICAIAALISIFGDLAASGIKRDHKMKDYADLIPGHGGVMDRIDSVIFVSPAVYYLALLAQNIFK